MINTKTCTFCALPATSHTDPPACGAHEDLMILVEWMAGKGETITAESVAAHVARGRASSSGWTITPGQVEGMLPAVMTARTGVKI